MHRAPDAPRTPGTAAGSGSVPEPRRDRSDESRGPAPTPAAPSVSPSPERTALILIGVACLIGAGYQAVQMFGTALAFPVEWMVGFALTIATLLVGYRLLRRIRPVRPPSAAASLVAVAWGCFAAIAAGALANDTLGPILSKTAGVDWASRWGGAVTGPLNEELIKLVGIMLVAVAFTSAVRGPMDGFVIGSLVGLGFQVMENLWYAVLTVTQTGGVGGVGVVLQSQLQRVLLTGLGTHWAMSALTGTAVGLLAAAAWRPGARRAGAALLLVLLPITMHSFMNSPILMDSIAIVIKTLVNFAIALAVYFVLRRAHRRRVRTALKAESDARGMDHGSAAVLLTRSGRRKRANAAPKADREAVRQEQAHIVDAAEVRAHHTHR